MITSETAVARVVPAIPSFSVDQGFRYRVPETLAARIAVGSLVRVPLSGRRVRGYVVDLAHGDAAGLREIAQISGHGPVFDPIHLVSLRWCANHYVAPLATILERAAPPNNPPATPPPISVVPLAITEGRGGVADRLLTGQRSATWLVARPDPVQLARAAARELERGRGTMVVLPTVSEAESLGAALSRWLGPATVVVHGDAADRQVTRAWALARHQPMVLVGTPRIAAWPVHAPGLVVVVEEGRRAMKDRQTPTVHVRDLLWARARSERFRLVFAGPTPSVEVVAAGAEIIRSPGRLWPLVEIVDRNLLPPGAGLLTDPARQAIRSVVGRGGRVFVYAHRRGYSAAVRCVRCRTVRRCPSCGSRPDPGTTCSRCGAPVGACVSCDHDRFEPLGAGVGRIVEEVGRIVGRDRVGEHPFDGAVSVGTERDLAAIRTYELVVFTDPDGLLFGTSYRAAEECLRIGARLAGAVEPGSGRRLLVQTTSIDHPVITALRRADPMPALLEEAAARATFGYPPSGDLIVIEARAGADSDEIGRDLEALVGEGGTVMGPASIRDGHRWLVQGASLGRFRTDVRPAIQRWRDSGATVRIDSDPIDL